MTDSSQAATHAVSPSVSVEIVCLAATVCQTQCSNMVWRFGNVYKIYFNNIGSGFI